MIEKKMLTTFVTLMMLFSMIAVVGQVNGQEGNGWIYGTVFGVETSDNSSTVYPLKDAQVCVIISGGGNVGEAIGIYTDENGEYNISVEPGSYPVEASKEGYSSVGTTVPVEVEANEGTEVNFELEKTEDIIEASGTVRFIELEGGFYGIVDDDGNKYDPTNLRDEFQEDGLRVKFSFKILTDTVSTHMWGTLIEVTEIELEGQTGWIHGKVFGVSGNDLMRKSDDVGNKYWGAIGPEVISINSNLMKLLECFPNTFQLLRQLLGLLG